jgi:hypothetical protein
MVEQSETLRMVVTKSRSNVQRKNGKMKKQKLIEMLTLAFMLLTLFACSSSTDHDEGEEGGTLLLPNEIHDELRNGVRAIIAYTDSLDAFTGTVENVTDAIIEDVRVEVHLSNGVELGPTPREDLDPGEIEDIVLPAEGNVFEWWSCHSENG